MNKFTQNSLKSLILFSSSTLSECIHSQEADEKKKKKGNPRALFPHFSLSQQPRHRTWFYSLSKDGWMERNGIVMHEERDGEERSTFHHPAPSTSECIQYRNNNIDALKEYKFEFERRNGNGNSTDVLWGNLVSPRSFFFPVYTCSLELIV